MEQQPTSEGKCWFYGKTFTKAGINRHLKTHLKQKVEENPRGISYLLKVETNSCYGSTPYFLSLWVNSTASMKGIELLRDIWLECYEHLSSFTDLRRRRQGWGHDTFEVGELLVRGKVKQHESLVEKARGKFLMTRKASTVFYENMTLEYRYDFGSSTELLLTVLEIYPVEADAKIVLPSRNEPLEWLCDTCEQEPATCICTDSLFCDKCAKNTRRNAPISLPCRWSTPRGWACAVTREGVSISRRMAFS
jgi:hypothetical protein